MKNFDKYKLYHKSCQDPSFDIPFINKEYKRLFGRKPLSIREDFCGSGYLSHEWVKQSSKHKAIGIDLDPETKDYAEQHLLPKLTKGQQQRMQHVQGNVLKSTGIKADVIAAFNFSYWIFRKRSELLRYFKAVRKSMKKNSVFLLDTSGGDEVVKERTERKRLRGYTYYWECEWFHPVTHECFFSIHFKPDGKKMIKQVFTYHWRYWTIPELRDILEQAGFSKSIVYWEGDDGKGGGNGVFTPTDEGENAHIWVAYIAALP